MGNACSENTSIQYGYDAKRMILEPALVTHFKYRIRIFTLSYKYLMMWINDIPEHWTRKLHRHTYVKNWLNWVRSYHRRDTRREFFTHLSLSISRELCIQESGKTLSLMVWASCTWLIPPSTQEPFETGIHSVRAGIFIRMVLISKEKFKMI